MRSYVPVGGGLNVEIAMVLHPGDTERNVEREDGSDVKEIKGVSEELTLGWTGDESEQILQREPDD